MNAADFISQTRQELQEKSEFWGDPELLVKLQRSYISLQKSKPFFTAKESFVMESDKTEYTLLFQPLKNVSMKVGVQKYTFIDEDNFYINDNSKKYTFSDTSLIVEDIQVGEEIKIIYKALHILEDDSSAIGLPITYHKALRLLFMSEIHEKPTRNTKERNLSAYYLKLYNDELKEIKVNSAVRPTQTKTQFQRI